MLYYGRSCEPGLWPGAEEDMADYDAWLTEYAVWEAMMTRQDQAGPGQDAPPG